jgi:hypothetical protein
MKCIFVASLAAGLIAAGSAGAWTRIDSEEKFRDVVVGRTWTAEPGHFVAHADGTAAGEWVGMPMTGTWYWDEADGFFCRDLQIGQVIRGFDCMVFATDGEQLHTTRNATGEVVVFTAD